MKEFLSDVWNWFYDWMPIIVVIVLFVTVIGGITWFVVADDQAYWSRCHDRGGHDIEVKDTHICVDEDNRVIYVDAPKR